MNTQDLKKKFSSIQANPSLFKNIALKAFEDTTLGGAEFVDPSNPVLFLLEASCAAGASAIDTTLSASRGLYRSLANSYEDIYKHMSDEDYGDRFGSPSSMRVKLLLPLDDIKAAAIPIDGTDTSKVTIGADTEYLVNGTSFYQHYPIDIIINNNDNVQVRYDVAYKNTFKDSRELDLKSVEDVSDGRAVLILAFNVDQLLLKVFEEQLINANGFNKTVLLDDEFYYAEAFFNSGDGWVKMLGTHSGQVYDATKATMVYTVGDGSLNMRIPEVYLTNDVISGLVRIKVYTTKGELEILTTALAPTAFKAYWKNIDTDKTYTAPMAKIVDFLVWSDLDVKGGNKALSFELLRDRTIYNTDRKDGPVAFDSMKTNLNVKGYQLSTREEHVLGRAYLASALLANNNRTSFSSVGSKMFTFSLDTAEDIYGDLIIVNDRITTITPKALFKADKQGVMPLSLLEYNSLMSSGISNILFDMNQVDYYMTPFYIVLDSKESSFSTRTYYLDSPTVDSKKFIANNPSVGFYVNTVIVELIKTAAGFSFKIRAEVPEGVGDIDVQLSLKPGESNSRYYLDPTRGVMNDGFLTFEVPITTNYLIDVDNNINISNLKDLLGNTTDILTDLTSDYQIVYVTETNTPISSSIDTKANPILHSSPITVLSVETGELTFGKHLPNMYSAGTAIKGLVKYQTHPVDVYKQWPANIPATDIDNNLVYTNTDGKYDIVYEHRAGDLVLDGDNNPIVESAAGTTVYSDGVPVILKDSVLKRELQIPLFDAAYSIATSPDIVKYRKEIPIDIIRRLETDIDPFAKGLIERSELAFTPSNTSGFVTVKLADNKYTQMNSALKLVVSVNLSSSAYSDGSIREANKANILEAIVEVISDKEVSTFKLMKKCQSVVTEDVVGLTIEGFEPDGGIVTLQDDLDNLTIGSKLILRSDGIVDIEDDVSFNWLAV